MNQKSVRKPETTKPVEKARKQRTRTGRRYKHSSSWDRQPLSNPEMEIEVVDVGELEMIKL